MTTLASLLKEYAEVRASVDRIEEWTDEDASKPFAPATEAMIARYEREIGHRLPPSFRAFLALHDGWQSFWGAMWIGGTAGKAHKWVAAQVAEWRKYVKRPIGSPDDDPECFDPAEFTIIGADDNGGFLVFGRREGPGGEREVLDMPRGFAENRWPTFRAFVEDQLRCRKRDLATAKRDSWDEDTVPDLPTSVGKKSPEQKPAKPAKKKPAKPAKKKPAKKKPAKPAKKKPAKKKPVRSRAPKRPAGKTRAKRRS